MILKDEISTQSTDMLFSLCHLYIDDHVYRRLPKVQGHLGWASAGLHLDPTGLIALVISLHSYGYYPSGAKSGLEIKEMTLCSHSQLIASELLHLLGLC